MQTAEWQLINPPATRIYPDAYLNFSDITNEFWLDLQKLAPFGVGNSRPLFWTRSVEVKDQRIIKGKHLILFLEKNGHKFKALYWNRGSKCEFSKIDISYYITYSNWNYQNKLELELVSFKRTSSKIFINRGNRTYLAEVDTYNKIKIRNQAGNTINISVKSVLGNDYPDSYKNKYIKSLFEEALFAFGYLP